MEYWKLNEVPKMIIFPCPLWIKCWIGLSVKIIIISLIATQVTIRSLLLRMIKRRKHSRVPTRHLPSKECLFVYAMAPQRFSGV